MARKDINIGIEGNDGTGDSIRDSFQKVNDNFTELYAVLGLEGKLSFIGLSDVLKTAKANGRAAEYLTADNNKILVVDGTNEQVVFKQLVGDSTLVINQTDPGVIRFSSLASALINDSTPTLAANLNANVKRLTNLSEAQLDSDAATKGYVDTKMSIAGVNARDPVTNLTRADWGTMTGPLVLSRSPIQSDDVNYNGLIAATKVYVDNKTFTSAANLYVTSNGSDNRTDLPLNQRGRSWSAAYGSISYAAQVAEAIIKAAPLELGPYRKTLTYDYGTKFCTVDSFIQSPLSGTGATGTARLGASVISIVAAGIGYEINDILSFSGGNPTVPTQLRVVSKDATGGITALEIVQPGIYISLPDNINNIVLVGGAGNGAARASATFKVTQLLVSTSGTNYGSASVIFNGGGSGSGAEGKVTVVAGLVKELTIVNGGSGYTAIPTIDIYLPRLRLVTENFGTDADNDLADGQLLRGLTSGAVARIINFTTARDSNGRELFDIETLTGNFVSGERVEYGQETKNAQVTIEVESGIYYEHFPIRLSANVSIKGTEFRRVQIRPKPGVSQSPWARLFFRRDTLFDSLRLTTTEYGYHYLTDPLDYASTPKDNREMDVFLAQDAVVVRNCSVQGHGGFMMVLDPEGQVSAKSPYMQVGSSFSGSTNSKRFAGGQFVDGFVSNMTGVLLDRSDDGTQITIGGLYRPPQLPVSFNYGSNLYRITLATKTEVGSFSAKTLLAANKIFIQTETIAWAQHTYGNTFTFDSATWYSNMGLIVDAVIEDILYGGYRNSSQVGRRYFSGGVTLIPGQVTQTAAAIRQAKLMAISVVNQTPLYSPIYGTAAQTTISSITDGGAAAAAVGKCFDIIANIVEDGANIYKGKALIAANKEFLQIEALKYIAAFYPGVAATYKSDSCKRDVGYVIDSISIDMFGDYNETLRSAYFYYKQGMSVQPAGELAATLDTYTQLGTWIKNILQGISPITPVRSTQTFDPNSALSIAADSLTIPNHPYTNGSKVIYGNGGGSSMTTDGGTLSTSLPYYVYVLDSNTIQLFQSLELVIAKEKGIATGIAVNLTGFGSGTAHTLNFYQTVDATLTKSQLQAALVLTDDANTVIGTIDNAISYLTAIIGGGDSSTVPDIYPQYKCVLDTPYTAMVGGKLTLSTPGNKSMLNNDFTQVNDLGYGIVATNNGLIESVSLFTYYCHTAFFANNGGQIRALNGSCCNGVYALRAEGADPNEVPDSVTNKFPLVQTATVYQNDGLALTNPTNSLTLYVTGYSYTPRQGCIVDIDHTGDAGGTIKIGFKSYTVTSVNTSGLPTGVAALSLSVASANATGLANTVTNGKPVVIRQNGELVIGGKQAIVATRPSTALVFDESTANVIRVTAFNPYSDVGAVDQDVVVTTRDGFSYVSLAVKKTDTNFALPIGHGAAGDDRIAIQSLNSIDAARVIYQITGTTIYPSTSGTGGMIFGYQDSIYEVSSYTTYNAGLANEYSSLKVSNLTNPNVATSRGTVSAITKASPCVVTTSTAHNLYNGRKVKFTGIGGMTQLNFGTTNYYYVKAVTIPNTVSSTSTTGNIVNTSDTSQYQVGRPITYATTVGNIKAGTTYYVLQVVTGGTYQISSIQLHATATTVSTDPTRPNQITLDATTGLSVNQAIVFYGTGFGNIVSGTTYYVLAIVDSTHITVTATLSGSVAVTLATATGDLYGGTVFQQSNATVSSQSTYTALTKLALYTDAALTTPVDSSAYTTFTSGGTISSIDGLSYSLNATNTNMSVYGGLRGSAAGNVTVNISTMRANGHDFLNIGTGSYADTNYPSDIYGPPLNSPDSTKEVREYNKGRVFYVSTDQSGNFKVGDYFGVDQGTGNLKIQAKINLSGIDTLRLRSGVEIYEFSNDTTMGGTGPANTQSTPTQNAVRTYIDSRLGLSNGGQIITSGTVGPGYVARDGSLSMTGSLDINSHQIKNLLVPTIGASGTNDAVPRNYITMAHLEDGPSIWAPSSTTYTKTVTVTSGNNFTVNNTTGLAVYMPVVFSGTTFGGVSTSTIYYVASINSGANTITISTSSSGTPVYTPAAASGSMTATIGGAQFGVKDADILAFTGTNANFVNTTMGGAMTLARSGNTLTATISSNVITNANINYNAAISQNKLLLNVIKAKSTDGVSITTYVNQSVGAPRVTLTAAGHGFNEGDSVIIGAEVGIPSINGTWQVYNVTTNTFDIPLAVASGTISGGIVRAFGTLSAADSTVFTVSATGYLSLLTSTSTTTGVRFNKLAYIDPAVYDATDNASLSGTSTKVLARRGTPASGSSGAGAVVPIDVRTIVDDGDGLSRAEVPNVGAVVRTSTGTGGGKFTTVAYASTNTVSNIVQRDGAGGFSAGAVNLTSLTVTAATGTNATTGEITLTGGGAITASGSVGIKMTANSTTATVLSRILDNAGASAYYTLIRDGQGNPAIRINTGTTTGYQYNAYYATTHNFYDASGGAGTVNVGNGGYLSAGSSTNTAQIVGNWQIGSGSRFQATWADLAEYYTSDKDYAPGTVVEFGGDAEVRQSSKQATTRVAGVVSTNPAYTMNAECPGTRVCVALQGRVPCKVVGKIQKGDLMISSQIPGVAISAGEVANPGTIIGKALETYDSDRIGTIEIAVGRL
jgi:hypothetical protein